MGKLSTEYRHKVADLRDSPKELLDVVVENEYEDASMILMFGFTSQDLKPNKYVNKKKEYATKIDLKNVYKKIKR